MRKLRKNVFITNTDNFYSKKPSEIFISQTKMDLS